jgi:hypothetical protein
MWVAKAGRWYSRVFGGPIVVVGEIHRQGGVAIAAHPVAQYWPAFDANAMRRLDGAEVVQPIAWASEAYAAQLRQFYKSAHLTAFGDSDFHGLGPIGACRTYVFAREATEQRVLDAIRAGRTVVYDRGRAYGDPALIKLAALNGRLPILDPAKLSTGFFVRLSRIAGIAGLLVAFFSVGGVYGKASAQDTLDQP